MEDINLMEIASTTEAPKSDLQLSKVASKSAVLDRHPNSNLFLRLIKGIRKVLNGSEKQAVKSKEDDPDQSGPLRMHDVPWIAIR
ncbi:MAG: hypothetical protein JSW47_20155 [Phycisphaerales bacterium]|nr:MAG: hypothetical protein JSW47_20155 [Phycisphaerales bacterium]